MSCRENPVSGTVFLAVLTLMVTPICWGGGIPFYSNPMNDPPGVHHYVYKNGTYEPHFYHYDPHPGYYRFSYDFPPHYTARDLSYYQGKDRGRLRTYDRFFKWFVLE